MDSTSMFKTSLMSGQKNKKRKSKSSRMNHILELDSHTRRIKSSMNPKASILGLKTKNEERNLKLPFLWMTFHLFLTAFRLLEK